MASVIPFTPKMTAAYDKAYASENNEDIDKRFDSLEKFVRNDKLSGLNDEEKEKVIKRLNYDRDYFKVLFDKGNKIKCDKCNRYSLASLYCELCVRDHLSELEKNLKWDSGDPTINNLISKYQKEAVTPYMIIEWIPFEDIEVPEKQHVSGKEDTKSAKVLKEAKWKGKEGSYYCEWDSKNGKLERNKDECHVVLRKLAGKVDEWIEEAKEHLNINNKWGCVVRCYGLTKDESGEYMLVMMKMDLSLEEYLKDPNKITFREVIKANFEAIKALSRLHRENYFHVNLHSSNILYLEEKGSWYIDISSYSYNIKRENIFKLGQLFNSLVSLQSETKREDKYWEDYKKVIKSCLKEKSEERPNIDKLWKSMEEIDKLTYKN